VRNLIIQTRGEITLLRHIVEIRKGKPLYQIFFLKNDEDQSVNVQESEVIDFEEIKKRLDLGESIFIIRKNPQQLNVRWISEEQSHFTSKILR